MPSEMYIKVRALLYNILIVLLCPLIVTVFALKYLYETFIKKNELKNIAGEVAVVDVTKNKDIEELNEKLTKDIGAATILVNNAGILLHSDPFNPRVEDLQLMVNVNFMSHFLTNRVFMKNMKEAKRGHIVAISSVSGLVILPFSEPYCSCKTGVRTLMRSLRAELMIENMKYIDCTTVFPYFLDTHGTVKQLAADSGFADVYPALKGEEVAKRVVQGMLRREVEITIPGLMMLTYRLVGLLPAKAQDWLLYMWCSNISSYSRVIQALKKE
ncbi:estradiol 17-beta-dehydrogenase 11 isoform X2 [Eurosta solidaginis]|uniref:estradiol 17-beta-dehydrogenase 11 isoform X2 n=1 Tax=Eurosta solidaginis TaxID=178769 RepID=UPI0035310371